MPRHHRARLGLEHLEARETPTVTASVNSFGDLVVVADAAADVAITQTAQGTYTVTDAGNPVGAGAFSGVTRDLRVTASAGDDAISIDLGAFSARNLVVQLGQGNNALAVVNGQVSYVTVNGGYLLGWYFPSLGGRGNDDVSVSGLTVSGNLGINVGGGTNNVLVTDSSIIGSLGILTGGGDDVVVLGDGVASLTAGSTVVLDGGGPNDALVVNGLVTLRNLYTSAVNDVTLAAGSTISGWVAVCGGFNATNRLTLGGRVDQGVSFRGSGGVDTFTLEVGASIGGGLAAALYDGNDVVMLDGDVDGSLVVDAGNGDDQLDLNSAIIGGATVRLGDGADTLNLAGEIGAAGGTTAKLTVEGGNGNDTVRLLAGSTVNGGVKINLGAGNDTAVVDDAATFVTASINGGGHLNAAPRDTFQGTKTRTGLTLAGFETFI